MSERRKEIKKKDREISVMPIKQTTKNGRR